MRTRDGVASTAAGADVRPAGVVLDIRAHTLPQFTAGPVAVFGQLLDVTQALAQAWSAYGQPTQLTYTVPSFFNGSLYNYQVGSTQQTYLQWVRRRR